MTNAVALITVALLGLLSAQAEPVTATLGIIWAIVHLVAIVRNWHEAQS
jgi:hypothetical protein